MFANLQSPHLDGYQRDRSIEEGNDVQKSARNIFGHYNCAMIVLWIPFPFYVPVFYGANDVGFVRSSELNLDLVTAFGVYILQKEVEAASPRVNSFLVTQDDVTKTNY